jgi:hypothetical protein
LAVACQQEAARPRSVEFFKEDGLAREGALARCNQNRDATAYDVECSNARRAAAAVAAERDNARSNELAAESERKLEAMRERAARAEQAQREAEIAAEAAEKAAYEAQWGEGRAPSNAAPALRDDTAYNIESLSQVPSRPELELAAVAPPVSEIRPEVSIDRAASIPRPFRDEPTLRR